MANRFPLVLDTTDNNKIKEIQSGDNLNLADNSIVGVQNITALGTINAADVRVNGNRLTAQAFIDLTDTPTDFINAANKFVKVNDAGDGLEFRPLSDLGNIEIDTITVDTSIVPSQDNVANIGTADVKFNEIFARQVKADLVSYGGSTVFSAVSGKISYSALQGAPTQLSDFTNDLGYLLESDLDARIAGLFDEGRQFVTDIQGSVFGDDSTVLVDAVNSIITGDVLNTSIDTATLTASQVTSTAITAQLFEGPPEGDMQIDAGASGIINIGYNSTTAVNIKNAVLESVDQGTGLGVAEITANTDLEINAGNRVKITGGVPFRFSSTTTALQLAISAQEGDVIYNTTTSRLQMYQGGDWKDVNGNVEATAGTSNFNDVVVAGNLIVQGTTTSIETTNTDITDNVITLNKGEVGTGVTSTTAGIEIDRGTDPNRSLVWTENFGGKWIVTDSATFFADRVEASYVDASLQLITDNIIMSAGNVTATNTLELAANGLVQIVSVTTDIELLPVGKVKVDGALEVTGSITAPNITSDLKGSVFGDDSGVLVDSVNGLLTGTLATTMNMAGGAVIDSADTNLEIRNVNNFNVEADNVVNVIADAQGNAFQWQFDNAGILYLPSGMSITDNGNDLLLNASSGATNVVVFRTDGGDVVVDAAGVLNADQGIVGDVTGNIDNTTLNVGATNATTITIGNAGTTTTINGIVSLPALVSGSITADNSISITTAVGDGNTISIAPAGTNTVIDLTANQISVNGTITTNIIAQGGVTGDLKGSVVADDSTVMIDGASGTVVGPIASTTISGTAITATTSVKASDISNLDTNNDVSISAAGFMNIDGGTAAGSGLSKIQIDQAGINYIELKTEPNNPANPTDYARISINAGTNEGDIRIGTPVSTRNQVVEIYNATVNGTLNGTMTGVLTGAVVGDVTGSVFSDDSTPMVDATERTMFSDALTLTPLSVEPTSPAQGQIAVADGAGWDPSGSNPTKKQTVIYLGTAWVQIAIEA